MFREVGNRDICLADQFRVAMSLYYGSHYYSVVVSAFGIRQRIEKRMDPAVPQKISSIRLCPSRSGVLRVKVLSAPALPVVFESN